MMSDAMREKLAKELELAEEAKKLCDGMRSRVDRYPDRADFRVVFERVLKNAKAWP
jgi:hypothetical protein